MIDPELRDLIAQTFEGFRELRASQAQTDEQMRRNSEEMRRNDERLTARLDRTDEQLRKTDEQLRKTDEQMRRNDERLTARLDRTDEQLRKTDEQLRKTDEQIRRNIEEMRRNIEEMKRNDERLTAKLERMGITLGNIGNNQGAVAEEFFYNSLKDSQTLAGVHYDFVDKNVTRSQGPIDDEFDIIMTNSKDVALIEVKYKAHEEDLTRLINKKYENFKKLFPAYKDHKHHLALATFALYDDVKELALSKGVMVLQRKGDVIETFLPA